MDMSGSWQEQSTIENRKTKPKKNRSEYLTGLNNILFLVEPSGIEPLTSTLPVLRSPS